MQKSETDIIRHRNESHVQSRASAELFFLGSALLAAMNSRLRTLEVLKWIKPEMLSVRLYRSLYTAWREPMMAGSPFDYAFALDLADAANIDDAMDAIRQIIDSVATSENITHYADEIVERYSRDQLHDIGLALSDRKKTDGVGLEEILLRLGTRIGSLAATLNFGTGDLVPMDVAAVQALAEVSAVLAKETTQLTSTGFAVVDHLIGRGYRPGSLIVIGAAEKSGKSSLTNQVFFNAASQGRRVLVFPTEMSQQELILKQALSEESIDYDAFQAGQLTTIHEARLRERIERYAALPIEWYGKLAANLDRVGQIIAEVKDRRGVDVVVLDNFNTLTINGKFGSRDELYDAMATKLKHIAVENKCAVIVQSQMNRERLKNGSKHPTFDNLYGSAALKRQFDMGFLVFRPGAEDPTKPDWEVVLDILRRKGKSYNSLMQALHWNSRCGRFETPAHDDQQPERDPHAEEPSRKSFNPSFNDRSNEPNLRTDDAPF